MRRLIAIAALLCVLPACRDKGIESNLSGTWKFCAGDDPGWAAADFDDSAWQEVRVPGDLSDSGLRKRGGHFWLRRAFEIERQFSRPMALELGVIADADEAFVDGERVGISGSFPPGAVTAFHKRRAYLLPERAVTPGRHVVAVRVYKLGGPGAGMIRGPVAITDLASARVREAVHAFVRSHLLVAAALGVLFVGAVHGFLWILGRRETQYLVFTGLSLLTSVYVFTASHTISFLAPDASTHLKAGVVAVILATHLLVRFVRASLRRPWGAFDTVNLCLAVGFSIFAAASPRYGAVLFRFSLWFPVLFLSLWYVGRALFFHLRDRHGGAAWAVAVPLVLLIVAVAHDVWAQLFSVGSYILNPYAFSLFCLGITYFLARDASGALADRSVILALAQKNLALADLANKDPLTGLGNRRLFESFLESEIARSRRFGRALSVALAHVDHFRSYNHRFGYPSGDRALSEVAWIIRENLREADAASRLNGPNFGLVFPGAKNEDAVALCRRMRQLIETFPFEHTFGEIPFRLTASIAVTSLTDRTATFQEFLDAAYRGLNRAREIRNTVYSTTFVKRSVTTSPQSAAILQFPFEKRPDDQ